MGLAGVNTGFLILTGIDKMVSKIKAFLDLYEHSLTKVYSGVPTFQINTDVG